MMDVDEGHSSNVNSEEEDSEMDTQTVKTQSEVFEQMRDLLKSQQLSLKQSLQFLQTKTTKAKMGHLEKNGSKSYEDKNSKRGNDVRSTVENEAERLEDNECRQWSNTSSKSRDGIQICPICGAEFDDPESPEALEEHVAGHWCSSESQ
jgi:hypothetical protein